MQLKKFLEKWDLASLRIRTPFLEMHWEPQDDDKIAAWELYIEWLYSRTVCGSVRMTGMQEVIAMDRREF
jgi:hypothetical protein